MKNLLFICLLIVAGIQYSLISQVIRFARTDVDGINAGFITATYSFGIDIMIDSIEHCSNVSFELSHNQTKFVKLSEYYRSEDWLIDNDWTKVITIIDKNSVDSGTDKATIAIEAGTGIPANINSPNNPKIIHLEFVVAPSAIHSATLDFTISKIKATYFKDTIIELIIPTTFKISYHIHSYVNVWPGDANCDGIVDTYDNSEISLYLTYPKNSSRSFRRPYASILWHPQMCIAWDTLAATFADCDGNGVVTTSDYAVVYVNYSKIHTDICNTKIKSTQDANNIIKEKNENKFLSDEYEIIPINISNIDNELVGAAGIIDYNDYDNIELIEMQAGEFFGENTNVHFYDNKETKKASFCISIEHDAVAVLKNNVIAYLYIKDNKQHIDNISITDLIGFNKSGKTKEIKQIFTSIELNNDKEFSANIVNGNLHLANINEELTHISVMNCLGNIVTEFLPTSDNIYEIDELLSGMYWVIARTNNKIFHTKFLVIK